MKPKITNSVNGKHEEFLVDDIWESICKVIRKARIAAGTTSTDPPEYLKLRIAALQERLEDLEGYSFHDGKGPV